MKRKLSDKKIAAWISNWEMFPVKLQTGGDKAFLRVLRELQRTREAIRTHSAWSEEANGVHANGDRSLYRATLPEAK